MSPILVIGATGHVGSQVAARLRAKGLPVRALVRKPAAARLPAEVELMQGDLTLPGTLEPALSGVDSLFLEWTFLRPGMFACNAPHWWGRQLQAGDLVRWPYLDVPAAPIDPRDIAAIGVRALCEPGHAGAEYVLTGPESLTQREHISIVGSVLRRSLSIHEMTPDEARKELVSVVDWGMAPATSVSAVIEKPLSAWGAAVGLPAFVSATFAGITGARPRTFRQWAGDHAAAFRAPAGTAA